ncbi:MAG: 16S rRNA (cytosine(967)-C(5))-methyltransferase RsmB [Myxococcales bacterium]|nr:16S rRNA (cytosine(967)-C(5))-methyltransferase RsmB [Myxococcales bacterium]
MDQPRQLALEVLRRVSTQGAFAGAALRNLMSPTLPAVDRRLVTELVYGVLRYRSHVDRALRRAAGRRLKDLNPRIHDVLRLGAYQIMYLTRVPDHAAVHSAVELAKNRAGSVGGRRTNQILRKLASTSPDQRLPPVPDLQSNPITHIAEEGSVHPDVARVLIQALGAETARAFALASLQPAPQTIRANILRAQPEALADEVQGTLGILPYAIRLPTSMGKLPSELAAVQDGRASPQDEASMRVVELLNPEPGQTMLDVCAAPGGKTCHAAERMTNRGVVYAYDRLPERLKRVSANAERLGLTSIQTIDILPPTTEHFDRVLVDAPCSGLGTLRRHPEIKWRFRETDLETLAPLQAKVLKAGADRVRPGGILVYSVCTVTPSEGSVHIRNLEGFELEEELSTGPQEEGAPDGFYAARLRRRT